MSRRCGQCGSENVAPSVTVAVNAGDAGIQSVVLEVQKDPHALIFKERVKEPLRAALCGDCGHVEIFVEDFERLYRAHLESRSS